MDCARPSVLMFVVAVILLQLKLAPLETSLTQDEQKLLRAEPVQISAIDYCYYGTIQDPVTGENVELYLLCPEDGFEQNMDLA